MGATTARSLCRTGYRLSDELICFTVRVGFRVRDRISFRVTFMVKAGFWVRVRICLRVRIGFIVGFRIAVGFRVKLLNS